MKKKNGAGMKKKLKKKIKPKSKQKKKKPKMSNTIVNPINFNLSKIHYSNPEVNSLPGKNLSFKRIRFNYEINNDLKPLTIESPPNLLSWGLSENNDMNTGQLSGYQMAINLWSKPHKTEEEERFVTTIDQICDHAKEHLVKNRESIEKYDLEVADLKKFNPLYWKMERGQRVPDKGPTLYAKTTYSKKDNKILTVFIDELKQKRIDPMSILTKHCYVKFALTVESIFIGTSISLQLKLSEVMFRLKDSGLRSALCPGISMEIEEDVKEEPSVETPSTDEVVEYEYEEVEEEEEVEEVEQEIKTEVIKPKVENIQEKLVDTTTCNSSWEKDKN